MASLRARSYLAVLWVHRWMGIILGLVVIAVSVTGALLVMPRTMQEVFQGGRFVITPGNAPKPLSELMQDVVARTPANMRLAALRLDDDPKRVWQAVLVDLVDRRKRIYVNVNPYTGELVSFGPQEEFVDRWLRLAHYTLFAGATGNVLTTLSAVALVLLSATGLWIYRGFLTGLWRPVFRLRLGWKTALTDLHKWLGLASLLLSLIWGVTGVIIMWESFLPASFQPLRATPEKVSWTVQDAAPLEPMYAQVRERFPGTELLSVGIPGTKDGPVVFYMLDREAPLWRKSVRAAFRADNGQLLKVDDGHGKKFGEALRDTVGPLHFGTFGSDFWRWVYFAGGWALVAVTISGFVIWWLDQRKRVERVRKEVTAEKSPAR